MQERLENIDSAVAKGLLDSKTQVSSGNFMDQHDWIQLFIGKQCDLNRCCRLATSIQGHMDQMQGMYDTLCATLSEATVNPSQMDSTLSWLYHDL